MQSIRVLGIFGALLAFCGCALEVFHYQRESEFIVAHLTNLSATVWQLNVQLAIVASLTAAALALASARYPTSKLTGWSLGLLGVALLCESLGRMPIGGGLALAEPAGGLHLVVWSVMAEAGAIALLVLQAVLMFNSGKE